jgi:chromosome segregation ATPase
MGEDREPDTYTPTQAGKILGITAHRVRQRLNAGELEGLQDERGHWSVPQRAVHALLEERRREERAAASQAGEGGELEAAGIPPRLFELEEELRRAYREMGRMEGRLELTEVTESTLRESLERERQRADQERERADRLELEARQLRDRFTIAPAHSEEGQEPQAPSEASTSSQTAAAGLERAEPPVGRSSPQTTTRRRPWWARLLSGGR